MTTTEATLAAAFAILAFWIVGAYNRIVRLRNDLVARFVAVDHEYRERQSLIERQLEVLVAVLAAAAPRVEALRAACRQANAARERARIRPGAATAVTSLRVAEQIVADARAHLPVPSTAGPDLPDLVARLSRSDSALAFARREFNAAVSAYNAAVRQFPTVLVARLFSFREAAAL